jgi:tetratricopeptide (TPR) repeat protein
MRYSEAKQVHGWLELAFGRGSEEKPHPLDLRIHRRLGELYLHGKDHQRAAAQFELCRKLAPRDLFVLRSLGQAYLEYDADAAGKVIDDIAALDPTAFEDNAESAALKGRWLRQQNALEDARDVYARALSRNPTSYYLAGRLAQCKLDLGDPDAKEAYERVLRIIDDLDEQNIWTLADAASAALAAGRGDEAVVRLEKVAALGPSSQERDSIERGLRELAASLRTAPGDLDELLRALSQG